MTKIDYNPSVELLEKLKRIKSLLKENDNISQTARIMGMHRSMVHALIAWDKKMKGGKRS